MKQLVIIGPTASGKTRLAVAACRAFGGELLSADSRQVYRGMDIGTGKDLAEFTEGGPAVRFHLIDIRDAGTRYTIHDYFFEYRSALQDVLSREKLPVLCGGSGLYVETALGKHPLAAVPINPTLREDLRSLRRSVLEARFNALPDGLKARLDGSTVKRMVRAIEIGDYLAEHPEPEHALPELEHVVVGVSIDRETRRERISARLHARLAAGMVEEVEQLHATGISLDNLRYYGLEYKLIADYLDGRLSYDEMTVQLETEIHRFAKRQMTWFRRMEKQGTQVHWINWDIAIQDALAEVRALLEVG